MGTNAELAKLFRDTALMLELEGVNWKPRAYEQAAFGIETFQRDARDVYEEALKAGGEKEAKKRLEAIPGIGPALADHIIEYLGKGKIKRVEELRKKYPEELTGLMDLEGIGPKKVIILFRQLGIKSAADLRKAAESHKIQKLPGFGAKAEQNMLEALEFREKAVGRMLLSEADIAAAELVDYLKKNAPVQRIDPVGSLRRMKETIGDLDVLVISDKPQKVMDVFTSMPSVLKVVAKGATKSTVILKQPPAHVDVRVVPNESYAAAMNYFTGSKEHNVVLRQEAINKGFKLSEYGLFDRKTGKPLPCKNEEELYKRLGMSYVPPEMRENRGEIDLAKKDFAGTSKLPQLVTTKDIRGDLHLHTAYSDGADSVEEMAKAAQEMGYEYILISDHSKSARIANGMDEARIRKQWAEIDRVSKKVQITILKGAEVDILKDGSMDYPNGVLKQLDIVIGSIHSNFKMPPAAMTKRILTALGNENVDILGHPTGRLIGERPAYEADFDAIFDFAAKNNKILEINSQPHRLDLNDAMITAAKTKGCRFSISTDAASTSAFDLIKYGLGQARRGWLTKGDVVNAMPLKGLMKIIS